MAVNPFIFSAARQAAGAALAPGAMGAQAAPGFRQDPQQEAVAARGMSMEQVRQLLGNPGQQIKYRNQTGPTLTYQVIGTVDTVFDVDFGANGEVVSANERVIPIDGDGAFDR